jgi:hypothetical protein
VNRNPQRCPANRSQNRLPLRNPNRNPQRCPANRSQNRLPLRNPNRNPQRCPANRSQNRLPLRNPNRNPNHSRNLCVWLHRRLLQQINYQNNTNGRSAF